MQLWISYTFFLCCKHLVSVFSKSFSYIGFFLLNNFYKRIMILEEYLRLSRGAKSISAVSDKSSIQVLIKMPFCYCKPKFSATLSTMIVLLSGRPNLLKSLTKTKLVLVAVGDAC